MGDGRLSISHTPYLSLPMPGTLLKSHALSPPTYVMSRKRDEKDGAWVTSIYWEHSTAKDVRCIISYSSRIMGLLPDTRK
uniref:Uncharacterized protein n=1 Tax=Pristionchus pacificus TaxID=54126 RepID=A0A2A6BSU5_PRIPA|eukprot:PDM68886.1 hypothetical protein PRIPAC_47188 [Pristionchus pacificus]